YGILVVFHFYSGGISLQRLPGAEKHILIVFFTLVGSGGVPPVCNFSSLNCPTALNAPYRRKSPELFNRAPLELRRPRSAAPTDRGSPTSPSSSFSLVESSCQHRQLIRFKEAVTAARADSEMLSRLCRGVIPATSWRVVYKSFSASSRNSS